MLLPMKLIRPMSLICIYLPSWKKEEFLKKKKCFGVASGNLKMDDSQIGTCQSQPLICDSSDADAKVYYAMALIINIEKGIIWIYTSIT